MAYPRLPVPPPVTVGTRPEDYDAVHAGLHTSPMMRQLWALALGDQYPAEVEPFGSCSWWVLGQALAALRLRPGALLVDLGCGRGGPGLWLARATSARLIGIDFSPAAVDLAAQRVDRFLPADRAEFRLGTLADTGLRAGCADGALCLDALAFAPDRGAALREMCRILAPHGRTVLTAGERPNGAEDWSTLARSAGLRIESLLVNPHHDEQWRRLYALWRAHAPQLRRELGERVVGNLLREAEVAEPRLGLRRALLMVLTPAQDCG